MQNSQEAFKAVHMLEGSLSEQIGYTPKLEPIEGPFGDALGMFVEDRFGTHCFPTSDFQVLPEGTKIKTLGISRFTMIGKRLVEFSLIVLIPNDATEAEAKRLAREEMDSFWVSFRSS